MATRRKFLKSGMGAGAALALGVPGFRFAHAQGSSEQAARNKAIVRRFKEAQRTPDYEQVLRETQSPDYRRLRAGFENLGTNVRGSELAEMAQPMGAAIPDRHDTILEMAAEGDMVGMRFRVQGTHEGNLFGIPATGRTIDIEEVGILRVEDGVIVEAWFMADEAALLKQLGVGMPRRADGRIIVPQKATDARFGQAVFEEIQASPEDGQTYRNKLTVAAYKAANPTPGLLPDRPGRVYDEYLRGGFMHMGIYGNENGVGDQSIGQAFPDREDKVDHVFAEGDTVWIQFRLHGTNTRSLFGLPPTNEIVEMAEVGIMTFDGSRWATGWFFGDDLGMALQLGHPEIFG